AQGNDQGHQGWTEDCHKDQGQHKTWKGEHHIHHAHDKVVYLASQEPRDAANERAHDESKPHDGDGNTEIIATAIHDPCEDIASILIETAKVRQGRAPLRQCGVALGGTIRRDPRCQQGHSKPKKRHQYAKAEERVSCKRLSDCRSLPGPTHWQRWEPEDMCTTTLRCRHNCSYPCLT